MRTRAPAPGPHLRMTSTTTALLLAKSLASDRRERRTLPTRPDGRPLWRAVDPRVHRPVFIVGAPRSGTTFLGGCVGAAPGVSYHFEPRLTKALVRTVNVPGADLTRTAASFHAFYSLLVLAAGDGGRRFVDKTPENAFIMPFLAWTFPDALFVHIIRDGRDVAVSHAEKPWLRADSAVADRRGRGGASWGPTARFWVEPEGRERFSQVSDLERSAWSWRRFTSTARAHAAELGARAHELRYEQLVAEPTAVLERLADFLDLNLSQRRAVIDAGATASASSVGRWRCALPAEQMHRVVRECGPLLVDLGYAESTRT